MSESQAVALLGRICRLEAKLRDADEYGDFCDSRVKGWRNELDALRWCYSKWITA